LKIQLSEHFTYKKLLRFSMPSMVMMLFTSIYCVVDGLFVSNFAGTTAFAAVNLIMPYIMIFGTLGVMIGTGGTALVSMTMGTGDHDSANRIFSQLVWFTILAGVGLSVVGIVLLRPAAILMGADGELVDLCVSYGLPMLPALPALLLQNMFQSFCVTAEKPNLGLGFTIAAGLTNIILDALMVPRFGIRGAAIATALSQCVGGFGPLIYFGRKNTSLLRLSRAKIEGKVLLRTCTNGSSELMSNLSLNLVSILYNWQLMKFAGEAGVAAYGVIMYVHFIFISIFLGFCFGVSPVIGFHYGAKHYDELKGLLRKCLTILAVLSLGLTTIAETMAGPFSRIFVSQDPALFAMTKKAFRICSLIFVMGGFNMFGSSFFTALNNGLISAAISFLRTLVCQVAAVLIMPMIFGLDGIWWSVVVADLFASALTLICFVKFRKRYHYA
jgi:putative MATE family efflux protein